MILNFKVQIYLASISNSIQIELLVEITNEQHLKANYLKQ